MNLSDIIAVAIIVAFSMHHRISGLLALLVVIACNPKCDWKMKQTKEGFTSTIEVSPVQNMKNVVKDNLRKAKTMTESFFSR